MEQRGIRKGTQVRRQHYECDKSVVAHSVYLNGQHSFAIYTKCLMPVFSGRGRGRGEEPHVHLKKSTNDVLMGPNSSPWLAVLLPSSAGGGGGGDMR